jgi:hypothetical protein
MERSVVTAIVATNHILQAYGQPPYEILPPPRPELLVRILTGIMRGLRVIFQWVWGLVKS